MKTKTFFIAIFGIAIASLGTYYILINNAKKSEKLPEINLLQLESIESNGTTYLTTGALISDDKESVDELNLIIKLGKKGVISTPEFTIYPSKRGKITIELSEPYQNSKAAAQAWLNTNGFGTIGENNFTFVNK